MIRVDNIYKFYGDLVAVNGVSFNIEKGQIYGLLGPNGAGKTTTMRMMYGLITPSKGQVFFDDEVIHAKSHALREKIGVLPDGAALYGRLTAEENIRYFAELHQMPSALLKKRLHVLAEQLGFEELLKRKVHGFSQGQRMKICLARALIHDPDYLFLDEPTNGLDVVTTRSVRHLLLALRDQNKAIIFSSHLMHEVERICDQIGIIQQGKKVAEGDIQHILQQGQSRRFEEAFVKLAYPKKAT